MIRTWSVGVSRALAGTGCAVGVACAGGLGESFSTLLGFRYLPLLALAFYLLSIWSPRAAPPSSV